MHFKVTQGIIIYCSYIHFWKLLIYYGYTTNIFTLKLLEKKEDLFLLLIIVAQTIKDTLSCATINARFFTFEFLSLKMHSINELSDTKKAAHWHKTTQTNALLPALGSYKTDGLDALSRRTLSEASKLLCSLQ